MQFSASNYSVVEACTTVVITVNRIGDTSGAASVDYFTSDVSASEHRDYITAIGTLRFAAGEVSRTIGIPIIDDVYAENDENFTITLSNVTGATLGSPATATLTIKDNETVNGSSNPIDDAAFRRA